MRNKYIFNSVLIIGGERRNGNILFYDSPNFDKSNFSEFTESSFDVGLAGLPVETRDVDLSEGLRIGISVVELRLRITRVLVVRVGASAVSASVS